MFLDLLAGSLAAEPQDHAGNRHLLIALGSPGLQPLCSSWWFFGGFFSSSSKFVSLEIFTWNGQVLRRQGGRIDPHLIRYHISIIRDPVDVIIITMTSVTFNLAKDLQELRADVNWFFRKR